LVENLKSYKRGLLSKIFPKNEKNVPELRFAGFTEKWRRIKLKEILSTYSFRNYITSPYISGMYPVIQQGDNPIAGYANGNPFMNYNQVVLFGDHTLSLYKPKTSFFIASDGLKILYSKYTDGFFLYYLLSKYMPMSEGYKRHYNILKEINVSFPDDYLEQHKIKNIFSEIDKKIEASTVLLDNLIRCKSFLLRELFI
jgi:type I restriction enzyme S subunit